MIIRLIKLIFNIIFTNLKLFVLKILNFKNFRYHLYNYISFNSIISLYNKGKMNLGKKVKVNAGTVLSAINGGVLKISANSFINNNCQIVAHKSIIIGKDVMIGPNVVIVDHDHKYNSGGIFKKEFKKSDIVIGNNVWIGANCVILKGTEIGDNSIVAAGSVIRGKYEANSLIIQSRNTEIRKIQE